ncbi:hypothetical protein NQ315_016784 [Exocentrus adspersus]|uniref:Small ribosomal subunit protein uS4 n=1 Tax=Exocentrus adspersus TaxID=1586481 RepID=A0AAV8VBS2_9CUCU|nr:hypothetical protein NQ315_016784 [Exocentrus adspersus]
MARSKGSKRYSVPLKPYDKDRLIDEMKILGEFGLKNKRELWTIKKICDDYKVRAKDLLISTNQDELIVSGRTLLSKLVKLGIISDVDYRDLEDIRSNLERWKISWREDYNIGYLISGLANSVHQARAMIINRHICVDGNVVDQPGFMVPVDKEGHIDFYKYSPLVSDKLGRSKKRKLKLQGE